MSGWDASGAAVFLVTKAKASAKNLAKARSHNFVGNLLSSSSSAQRSSPLSAARARSRSPQREALPGFRADAPGRLERRFAGLPRVLSEDQRAQALDALDADILAASTLRTNTARLHTIESALALWGIPMWPPTVVSWKALAATLKWGGGLRIRVVIFLRLPHGR